MEFVDTKTCCRCKYPKDPTRDFTKNKSRKDGLNPTCRECHRKSVNDHYKKKPHQYINKAKRKMIELKELIDSLKTSPCLDCGGVFNPWQMDFDHRDPKIKDGDISKLTKWGSKKKILDEIKKCDLVCANCHRERTHRRGYAFVAQRIVHKLAELEDAGSNPAGGAIKGNWPSDDQLKALVEAYSMRKVGEMIGVSDNAVRKRCMKRSISIPLRRFYN